MWFEQQLREHPLRGYALDELDKRGLSFGEGVMDEALRAFRIGYAPAGWDGLAVVPEGAGHLAARRGDGRPPGSALLGLRATTIASATG